MVFYPALPMLLRDEGQPACPHIYDVESDHYWKAKRELVPLCCMRGGVFGAASPRHLF